MPDGTAALDTPTAPADCDDILREWLRGAEECFNWFRHVAASHEVAKATKQFATRANRARGRIALQRAFEPSMAALSAIGDQGSLPYLCWTFYRPRDEARIVSINFAMVLRFPDGRVSIVAMTWTADVTHDALSDALRGGQDLDGLLMQLHGGLLDAPESAAEVTGPLAVPAGGGWFVGRFVRGAAGDQPAITFNVQRWMPGRPDDAELLGAAAEGEARLSDHWLDPLRLASAQWPGTAQPDGYTPMFTGRASGGP